MRDHSQSRERRDGDKTVHEHERGPDVAVVETAEQPRDAQSLGKSPRDLRLKEMEWRSIFPLSAYLNQR